MSQKVDIQEISNALLASAAREEELLVKNANLQKELEELKENQTKISFVDPVAEENTEVESALEKEASHNFDPYNMGEVVSSEEPEVTGSASDKLMNWMNHL